MQKIAEERFARTGFRKPIKLTFRQFFVLITKALTSWITYAFTLTYAFWSWSQDANTWFSLFLKSVTNADGSKLFSNNQLTAIPIGGYVMQIVSMVIWAYLSDKQQRRCRYIVIQQVTTLVGTIILSTWPANFGLKMFAYFFLYLSNAAGPLIIAWMSDMIGTQNTEMRTIYIGLAVCLVNAIDSFQNIFIYPASEAPNYRIGYKAGAAYAFASIAGALLWKFMSIKDPSATGLNDKEAPLIMTEVRQSDSDFSDKSNTSPLASPIDEEAVGRL